MLNETDEQLRQSKENLAGSTSLFFNVQHKQPRSRACSVAGVEANWIPCTSYCSKAGEMTFFVYVEDLQKIIKDAVYSKQKMHSNSYFNQQ